MFFPVNQNRTATFFFSLGFSSLTTAPSPSTCGGGAGGGLSVDVLSATLFAVGFDEWRARPCTSEEGKGGMLAVSFGRLGFLVCCVFEDEVLLKGRVVDRLESLESGEGPCALVLAQERMRSKNDSESEEVFFIDVVSDTQMGGLVSGRK